MEYIIEIIAVLAASSIIMIIHELPKSIMYIITGRHCKPEDKWKIFKLYQYIDPVGLILFLTCHAGCSRPYPYRLKEKDTNVAIGLTGLLTLCVSILGSFALYYQFALHLASNSLLLQNEMLTLFIAKLNWYLIYASIVLFITNLIPATTSDMFLLIIAISPSKMITLMKNDTFIKGLLLFAIVLGIVSSAALNGMDMLNRFLGFA